MPNTAVPRTTSAKSERGGEGEPGEVAAHAHQSTPAA